MLESSSCVFPHRFHQIFAVVTSFAHIVPVLSSNSEPIFKTGLVFAYELRFRRSIYQNRLEKIFGSVHPPLCRGSKILDWSKSGHKILFSWSQGFCRFWASFLKIPQTTSFTFSAHIFCGYFFCAHKWRKNIKKNKKKKSKFPKKTTIAQKNRKKREAKEE